MNYLKKVVIGIFCLSFSASAYAQSHPSLMLTNEKLEDLRKGVTAYPILKDSYKKIKKNADAAIRAGISVPKPADGGGGVTHEQHKKNYQNIVAAGVVFQITKNPIYADFVKNTLLAYASQYESWPLHPKQKSSNGAGRIFWQILNDCVWQVNAIQGYDLVYDAIDEKDRKKIEEHLFIPILAFITEDHKETFNKVHNHGTWAVAAVGITGYVLGKENYVEMALKGSDKSGDSGFLKQIDSLFSPSGYYTEGFYYQRYALWPFMLFAKAIHQYQPELKIFSYRDSLLKKAVYTALQGTYTTGYFFPINDAIKDKSFETTEMVYGVDLAYADLGNDPELLSIAKKQGNVIVSDAGLAVASAIAEGKAKPFNYKSLWIGDGKDGTEGGLGILRHGPVENQQALLFKATSQGMGHGHFDRLNILYYDNGTEVFPDYGAARFINIETKGGGGYLPENTSWAKQTIAHNTLVVDETSAFKGKLKEAEKYYPEMVSFKAGSDLQWVSAKEVNAYPGVEMLRTAALIQLPDSKKPLLVDIFKVAAKDEHQYDLPFWYKGTIVDSSFEISAVRDDLKAMGTNYGYQHLWLNAEAKIENGQGYVTILNKNSFYTTTYSTSEPIVMKLVSLGANDPEMNLVESKAFILSQPRAANHVFVSITENHGTTNPVAETIIGSEPTVKGITIEKADEKQVVFTIRLKNSVHKVKIDYEDKNNLIQIIN